MRSTCENANPECKYAPRCYSDEHHLAWPRSDYRTKVERDFRNLSINKVQICRAEHDELHLEEPPTKPTRDEMLGALALERHVA